MRNSDGYIYVEMLAAFFVCFFISLSILPIFEKVMADRKDSMYRMEAYHLLYERLQAYMEGESEAVDGTIIVNGKTYKMTWMSETAFIGMVQGCIEYEKVGKKRESVCDAAKR